MQAKKILMTTGMILGLAAVAACSSTKPTDSNSSMTEVRAVQPQAKPKPSGPVAGSFEDFKRVGHRVYFDYDQYTLSAQSQAMLKRQAGWLQQYPNTRIRIAGNCDERGTREYNLALGARRADAAKAYLTSLGVDPARITTISYGKERPIAPGSNESAWSKNRNATTLLVTTGAGS